MKGEGGVWPQQAVTRLPVVAWTAATFGEKLTAVPLHASSLRRPRAGDESPDAAVWTGRASRDSAEGHRLDPQALQQILAPTSTTFPKAQAAHVALIHLSSAEAQG